MRLRLLLLASMAAAAVAVMPGRAQADTCSGITFANATEQDWVQRVTTWTSNLTCSNARYIYRNQPSWRDEMPGSMVATAGVVASPAVAEAAEAGATLTCTVWTRNRYRAPIIPFGDHVLWTFYMEQSWGYNNSTVVWVSDPITRTDKTANGFRWIADGAPWGQSWWVPADRRLQHHTDRNQKMTSQSIPNIGLVSSVSYLHNWKQWNGDWASSHDQGLAGCRDDD
jgi:hypothetical protein